MIEIASFLCCSLAQEVILGLFNLGNGKVIPAQRPNHDLCDDYRQHYNDSEGDPKLRVLNLEVVAIQLLVVVHPVCPVEFCIMLGLHVEGEGDLLIIFYRLFRMIELVRKLKAVFSFGK